MKKIVLALTLLISVAALYAEGNKSETNESKVVCTLEGQITDKLNNEALTGVEVTLEGTSQTVYTNFDGEFTFENVTPGMHKIQVEYVSYEIKEIEIEANVDTSPVEIQLDSVSK